LTIYKKIKQKKMPPKRVPVYTRSGKPTKTTVRVRNGDGVVYRQDRPKIVGDRPAPKEVPRQHRFLKKSPVIKK
jgi:hypothetical protein